MHIPPGPLWVWTLHAGEDGQYFSQPPVFWAGNSTRIFVGDGACLARCTIHTWTWSAEDRSDRTYDVLCGQVAALGPDGRQYLCPYHFRCLWECPNCQAVLASEDERYCSAACQTAFEAAMRDAEREDREGAA